MQVYSSSKVKQSFSTMHRRSNLSKLLPQNLHRWKVYSPVYLQSKCNQLHAYSTMRGGHVTNVPDVCKNCQVCRYYVRVKQLNSVQFKMVAMRLEKAHMRSTPSLRSFPNVVFETVPMFVWLMMTLSRPFKEDRVEEASFHVALLQAIGDVMSLALCPQVMSQAPQHFRSSEKQASCEGCFARQSICSVISFHSLHSGMSRAVHLQKFSRWMPTIDTFRSGPPESFNGCHWVETLWVSSACNCCSFKKARQLAVSRFFARYTLFCCLWLILVIIWYSI